MNFRSILFWMHLGCGVTAGLVILTMSVTGVLITYERQMVAWADRAGIAAPAVSETRLPPERWLEAVRQYAPDLEPVSLTVSSDPETAIAVALGRERVVYLDPYTGQVLGEGAAGLRRFFALTTNVHRWFNVGEGNRAAARAITGASNLVFLFIVLSGMYLWLPRFYRWSQFRMRLLFAGDKVTGKARDFNWHHVFGIWSALPLAVVVATATVFSYPWASNLVYRAFGEEPPVRGAAPRGPGPAASTAASSVKGLERHLQQAGAAVPGWKTVTLRFPLPSADSVSMAVDRGLGGQPHLQSTVILDAETAAVTRHETFADLSPGRRARSIIRRLHTGEVLGVAGQTVAGMVSLGAVMLVWTGLALAWRRLIQPLFRRARGNRIDEAARSPTRPL